MKTETLIIHGKIKVFTRTEGLRIALLGHEDTNMGRDLENIVYLELLRRGYRIHVGKVNTRKRINVLEWFINKNN